MTVHYINIGGYLSFFASIWKFIPGNELILWYIKKSYKNDPYRVLIELLLLFFAGKYLLAKTYRQEKNYELNLSEKVRKC